jgi:prevent-host-death family protein
VFSAARTVVAAPVMLGGGWVAGRLGHAGPMSAARLGVCCAVAARLLNSYKIVVRVRGRVVPAVSISHARENLFPLVRQVSEDHVVIEIVARRGGNAVLMSAGDYESLQETLYLFSARADAAHIPGRPGRGPRWQGRA